MVFQLIGGMIDAMKRSLMVMVLLGFVLVGCSGAQTRTGAPAAETATPTATQDPTQAAAERYPAVGVIYQWGSSAEASTEFANPEWGAAQAAGEPDLNSCGDFQFAWASAASDSIETIEISYDRQVYPLEIVIHQSFNPDQVVKVEVLNPETGGYYTILQKNPVQVDRPCPYLLMVEADGIDFATNLVRITVDQSQLGLGWNEIDAVQLIGSVVQP